MLEMLCPSLTIFIFVRRSNNLSDANKLVKLYVKLVHWNKINDVNLSDANVNFNEYRINFSRMQNFHNLCVATFHNVILIMQFRKRSDQSRILEFRKSLHKHFIYTAIYIVNSFPFSEIYLFDLQSKSYYIDHTRRFKKLYEIFEKDIGIYRIKASRESGDRPGKLYRHFQTMKFPNEISFDGRTTYVETLPRGKKISWNALISLEVHVQGKAE